MIIPIAQFFGWHNCALCQLLQMNLRRGFSNKQVEDSDHLGWKSIEPYKCDLSVTEGNLQKSWKGNF